MNVESVSIKDVAARAGVSLGTVSNVLNRPETVAEPTRRAVQTAIRELNYVRHGSASRLRAKKSTIVGILVVDLANPFVADYVEAARGVLEASGYTAFISSAGLDIGRVEHHLQLMEEQRVAGVVLPPMSIVGVMPRIQSMRARGMSFVFIGGSQPDLIGCFTVVDQRRGGELVGEHLLEIGRRRIVVLGGPAPVPFALRREGLESVVAREPDVRVAEVDAANMTGPDGYAATEAILAHEPDAIFCANDLTALGVLRGLLEHGVRVPDEIALVGYDDISFAEIAAVPLTTIRQPSRALGAAAARLLIDEATEQDHVHRHVSFAPELVVRGSTVSSGRKTDTNATTSRR